MAAWSPLRCMITKQELSSDVPCTLHSAIVPTTPYGGDSLGKTLMLGKIEGRYSFLICKGLYKWFQKTGYYILNMMKELSSGKFPFTE